jgi:hypothetical protein
MSLLLGLNMPVDYDDVAIKFLIKQCAVLIAAVLLPFCFKAVYADSLVVYTLHAHIR